MTRRPEDILKDWMQAINKGDIKALLALYDKKAVVIPTFSNRLLNTPAQIRDYFEKLGAREELSVALHERTLNVQPMTGDLHALCGIYCWRFEINEELLSFEARFSFLFNLALPGAIIHHHSSQIPRML